MHDVCNVHSVPPLSLYLPPSWDFSHCSLHFLLFPLTSQMAILSRPYTLYVSILPYSEYALLSTVDMYIVCTCICVWSIQSYITCSCSPQTCVLHEWASDMIHMSPARYKTGYKHCRFASSVSVRAEKLGCTHTHAHTCTHVGHSLYAMHICTCYKSLSND